MIFFKYITTTVLLIQLTIIPTAASAEELIIESVEGPIPDKEHSLSFYYFNVDITEQLTPRYRNFVVAAGHTPKVNRTGSFDLPEMVWPTDSQEVSSDYGYRKSPCKSCSTDHKGIDFIPGKGEPVYAAMDGIVSRLGNGWGFGIHVSIIHVANIGGQASHWETIYAHMEENSAPTNLKIGDIVEAGTKIGTVGNTGISTGPHLHFEIIVDGENVDPEKYLNMYAY